ncbi:uncharacterized protein [Dysidea avara]|uniref:uncharacterized protein n=1 Tax=Dysidea avara TaxID=196820 RepID=UPI003319845E
MSHINGDITRTRELLSQAVRHLDSYNATRSPATSSHNTATSSGAPMPSQASLHYSLVPPPSRQQETSTFSQRQSNFRPRVFRPTFHPGKPAKKKKLAKWQNDFVCLASTTACKVPNNMDKADSDFYEDIVCAYPKLRSGGGFELLRSCEGNSKELVIPPPPAGYTVSYNRKCTQGNLQLLQETGTYALAERAFKPLQSDRDQRVCFIGEAGVDTGGPSREFFRLLMMGVDETYCCGNDGAKVFMHDVPAIQESHFRTIGTFVAMSIIQGGFGLPIFSQHLYSYLVTGKYVNLEINNDDVPDPAAQALLKQIGQADTDEKLRDIFVPRDDKDDLSYLVTDTGYRIPLTCLKVADKANLCKAVREYHTIIKVLPEINQFGEGLEVLGVLTMVRKYPELLSLYFIDKEKKPINKAPGFDFLAAPEELSEADSLLDRTPPWISRKCLALSFSLVKTYLHLSVAIHYFL